MQIHPAGEKRLPKPREVRFAAEIAHHLLRWEPGHDSPSDVCYEVEHKVYGTNSSWTPIPDCMKISGHSCDLTYYTLVPALRYYARVRAVSGNHTSPWQRTNAFSPQEASLRLSGQSLSVRGNTIHVQLQLLLRAGNLTVKYDDIQKHTRQYRVYVRRAQDNRTFEEVKKAPEFVISNLFWDTEYCVSVEPEVASRRTRAARTAEQCLAIGHRHGNAELVLSILSFSFITLLILGLLGALLACTYIKKPMRPPSVLKSFIKQSPFWVDQESPSSGSSDADAVQQLFLCQKEPQKDSSPSTAQLPLEKGWKLPAWPEDQLCLLGLRAMGSRDSSCTSTDSGICLRSSDPSCSSGHKPQGYKQQVPTGDDSGVGLGSSCPCPTCPSSSGMASEPLEAELSPSTLQQAMEFHGYLQQSQGTQELQQDPDKGVPFLGHPSTMDIVLGAECSELPVAKGYLKQSSPEQLYSHTQDLAPWGALSCGAPGAPLDSKASPELKAPFNLSIFNTDLLGTLPLISSLSTNEWLQLQIQPLNLPNGDSKDSRL
ncbi:PREDICTED: interleukin-10 receptor subunit alpha [Chaetura pelagica]|uniref:interleukin-10 receptor subunit alpha n=1 Tax=Chaetura pelagica TaxID=8897 RepID=UPI0005235183|nr:PREDICTED: interleukin-10 receptor subunit alpha [Chaetura pelagica]